MLGSGHLGHTTSCRCEAAKWNCGSWSSNIFFNCLPKIGKIQGFIFAIHHCIVTLTRCAVSCCHHSSRFHQTYFCLFPSIVLKRFRWTFRRFSQEFLEWFWTRALPDACLSWAFCPALDQRLRRKLALMSASTSGVDSAASSWLTLSQHSVSLLELGLCQILTGGQNMEYYFKLKESDQREDQRKNDELSDMTRAYFQKCVLLCTFLKKMKQAKQVEKDLLFVDRHQM